MMRLQSVRRSLAVVAVGAALLFGIVPFSAVNEVYGHQVKLPVPVREGFQFMGWFVNPDGSGEKVSELTVKADTTLYASWKMVA